MKGSPHDLSTEQSCISRSFRARGSSPLAPAASVPPPSCRGRGFSGWGVGGQRNVLVGGKERIHFSQRRPGDVAYGVRSRPGRHARAVADFAAPPRRPADKTNATNIMADGPTRIHCKRATEAADMGYAPRQPTASKSPTSRSVGAAQLSAGWDGPISWLLSGAARGGDTCVLMQRLSDTGCLKGLLVRMVGERATRSVCDWAAAHRLPSLSNFPSLSNCDCSTDAS